MHCSNPYQPSQMNTSSLQLSSLYLRAGSSFSGQQPPSPAGKIPRHSAQSTTQESRIKTGHSISRNRAGMSVFVTVQVQWSHGDSRRSVSDCRQLPSEDLQESEWRYALTNTSSVIMRRSSTCACCMTSALSFRSRSAPSVSRSRKNRANARSVCD